MTKNNAVEAIASKQGERTSSGIFGAFLNVCAGVENVKRTATGQVGQQKYKYATLGQVLDMINPLLEANDLALAQYVDEDKLCALLIHKSGQQLPLGGYNLGLIGKHQERGSAITYGRRYQLCSIFGITQEDDDGTEASKVQGVFPNATKRNDWIKKLTEQLEASPDLGELKATWEDALPILQELKDSSLDYDQVAYEHMVKIKDLTKASIQKFASE